MYLQITPTFPDAPHDVPHDIPQAIKDELEDIIIKMAMLVESFPEHLWADEFWNKNSQELTTILFNTDVPIEIINKVLKQYTEIYAEMKEANDEMIGEFTAENFIQVLHMVISEEMANEGPVRKKPRV
jgi:signal recognition particle GTPase